jgi:hypothetical protein
MRSEAITPPMAMVLGGQPVTEVADVNQRHACSDQPARCPICGALSDDPVAFRDHLAVAHELIDDEGTDTIRDLERRVQEIAEQPPAPALPIAPAPPAAAPQPGAETTPLGPPTRREASTYYPLALRYGDVALYVPGVILLVTGLIEGNMALVLSGLLVSVLGILMPVIHRRGTAD